jgi:hypothetical protein
MKGVELEIAMDPIGHVIIWASTGEDLRFPVIAWGSLKDFGEFVQVLNNFYETHRTVVPDTYYKAFEGPGGGE